MPVSAALQGTRQAAYDARLAAAREVIPEGLYCYRPTGMKEVTLADGTVVPAMTIKMCPFWKRRGDWPSQANGYCRFLKVGDHSKNRRSTMLLWDQVKECGINEGDLEDAALSDLVA